MSLAEHRFFKLNRDMQPYADAEYTRLWPGCRIERLSRTNGRVHELDKSFAIDTILHLPNGLPLTVQEKFREYNKAAYGDFTLEYMNDPETGEEGEWFHLCADIYFYGYANKARNGWFRWYLLKILDLKLAILSGSIRLRGPIPNTPPARANFYAAYWAQMHPDCILASYNPIPWQKRAQQVLFG